MVSNLDIGVLEMLGQASQVFRGHDVTALDGDDLPLRIASVATRPRPAIALSLPFTALGVRDVEPSDLAPGTPRTPSHGSRLGAR